MASADEGVKHALECWNLGFNCAESVMRGVCYSKGIQLTEQAMKMATPFGGGIGRSEDVCGALSGGVLAIGLMFGRIEPTGDKTRSYDAAHELHQWFGQTFGSTACSALNRGDFKSPEHKLRCTRFVEETARKACMILGR